jgi:hypothetical protein
LLLLTEAVDERETAAVPLMTYVFVVVEERVMNEIVLTAETVTLEERVGDAEGVEDWLGDFVLLGEPVRVLAKVSVIVPVLDATRVAVTRGLVLTVPGFTERVADTEDVVDAVTRSEFDELAHADELNEGGIVDVTETERHERPVTLSVFEAVVDTVGDGDTVEENEPTDALISGETEMTPLWVTDTVWDGQDDELGVTDAEFEVDDDIEKKAVLLLVTLNRGEFDIDEVWELDTDTEREAVVEDVAWAREGDADDEALIS